MQATVRHHSLAAALPGVRRPRLRTVSALGTALLTLLGVHEH